MVNLKNTIYLFLFGDVMKAREVFERNQKEMERIGAEEKSLSGLENSYRAIIRGAENRKRTYSGIGSKLLASLSKSRATQMRKTITEQDSVINEMKRGLQQIEKRKNEIAKLRQKKEIEKAQTEANVRKVMVRMGREHAELQRQQQRAREIQEKWDRTGTDFGATRLIKRRKR